MPKAERETFFFEPLKFRGFIKPYHGPMGLGRLEVLPNRENHATRPTQVLHHRAHFPQGLTQSHHQPGFRDRPFLGGRVK